MTHPDFTCTCGNPVEVFPSATPRPRLWHTCRDWSGGASAPTLPELAEFWNAEKQRKGRA